ncbi:MAG: Clp protease ClpP [Candidatus Cloacimonetes bacterium]|nr:Clp protease ClpP [Candidatus Cloacimonadota bacterium]
MKNSKKFWNWLDVKNEADTPEERVLEINGEIASESWFDDDVTPKLFKDELLSGNGPITIWLNSPGGDCIAASQIYSMLMDYAGEVTIKIDGIAASAASVIAMAGTKVLMAPTALMMIHNPMTMAWGDKSEMTKAIEMLDEVKESIVNAYEIKTGMSRAKISHLMDSETWMNANKAIELGFADDILEDKKKKCAADEVAFSFAAKSSETRLMNKLEAKFKEKSETKKCPLVEAMEEMKGTRIEDLDKRLSLLK